MKYNLLKEQEIRRVFDGTVRISAVIYNDAKGRFKDGMRIRTSPVRKLDLASGIAETENTRYELDLHYEIEHPQKVYERR